MTRLILLMPATPATQLSCRGTKAAIRDSEELLLAFVVNDGAKSVRELCKNEALLKHLKPLVVPIPEECDLPDGVECPIT